jgi:uncharacterized protein YndB with AHSA1/START domain
MTDDVAQVELVRRVAAPAASVFAAFTDAEQLARWWGPEGFGVSSARSDPRPGGAIEIVMVAPDGSETPTSGTYRQVAAPSHLVIEMTAYRPDGTALLTSETTVDLTEGDAGAEIRVRATGRGLDPAARPMLGGMEAGWNETLDRLERHLAGSGGATIKMRHDTV